MKDNDPNCLGICFKHFFKRKKSPTITLCTILMILLTFFLNHHFCHFTSKRLPELALKTGILVPKVRYDLPEFNIRPWDHIAPIHTRSKEHMGITRFSKKCQYFEFSLVALMESRGILSFWSKSFRFGTRELKFIEFGGYNWLLWLPD